MQHVHFHVERDEIAVTIIALEEAIGVLGLPGAPPDLVRYHAAALSMLRKLQGMRSGKKAQGAARAALNPTRQ